jgi:hypothetical protein
MTIGNIEVAARMCASMQETIIEYRDTQEVLVEALKVCLKAENERRAKLKPGAPATTYTEARIEQVNRALALVDDE